MNTLGYQIAELLGINYTPSQHLDVIIGVSTILLISIFADLIIRHIVLKIIVKLVRKTKATWDDILFHEKVLKRISNLVAPIVFTFFVPLVLSPYPFILNIIHRICMIVITILFILLINENAKAIYTIYSSKERYRNKPLQGILQTIQVVLIFIGVIIVISILIDKSPMALITALGASAAIIILVFKDSILGVVSGVQLSANNMLKVGDWISLPKYNADGTVIEVTLNTVKIQNWDNTITTVPPYLLVSDSFQNWRGMEESGGRRIKRSVFIDLHSVKFCTPEMLQKYKKIKLLSQYIEEKQIELNNYNTKQNIDDTILVNGRRQTNIGVFRAYINSYLRSLPELNQNLTLMVRQLQPTEKGIPLEIYCFSNIKSWVPYEQLQADIFDHIFAIVSEFELSIFQTPSGNDVKKALNP